MYSTGRHLFLKCLKCIKRNFVTGFYFIWLSDDRKFAILGDAGINMKVPENFWDNIKETCISHFSKSAVCRWIMYRNKNGGETIKRAFPIPERTMLTNLMMKFHLEENRVMKNILLITLAFLFVNPLFGQNIPKRPNPPRLVNDFASILSRQEESSLEMELEKFARETSTQIVIVTLTDLENYDIADYAFKLGEDWGVGQKDKNNGIVILLKPKTLNEKGEVFIATGYGIEHLIPDAVANNQIVYHEMIPHFKQNDYYSGLAAGVKVIMDLTRGEYTADAYKQSVGSDKKRQPVFLSDIYFSFYTFTHNSRKERTLLLCREKSSILDGNGNDGVAQEPFRLIRKL